MENRTPVGALEKRNAAVHAWHELCERARCTPDMHTALEVAARIRARGGDCTDEQSQAVYRAMRDAPHVCPVSTWHLTRPCREGQRHPGCCPGRCPYEPKRR
jgi:hypothetical protein